MINISMPYDNRYFVNDAHISRMNYFGSHYEVTLCADGKNVLMVFGRRMNGCFVYFPTHEEGFNLSFNLRRQENIEKISLLFDGCTSAAIVDTINHFLGMEGEQE